MPAAYSRSEYQVSLSRLVPGVLTALWTAGSQSGVWIAEISDGFHFGRMEWLNHVAGMEDYFCCRWIDENYLLIWSVCWFSYWLIPLPSTELCHSWKRILQIPSHFRSFLQTPWWFLSKASEFRVWPIDQQHQYHWELVGSADSQAPSMTLWVRIFI